jgi:hypothetical protein
MRDRRECWAGEEKAFYESFYETALGIKVFSFFFIGVLLLLLLLSLLSAKGLWFGFLSDFYPHSNWVLLNPVPVGVRW